jgi:hypothetical protein
MGILADYNISIEHHPGTKNRADPLSRRPDHDDGSKDNLNITILPDQLFTRVTDITEVESVVINAQKNNECYDCASWTIIFLLPTLLPPFSSYYTTDTLPLLLVIALSWICPLIPRLGQDALRTVCLPPLSITCLTLALTVLLMRASVPADVHPCVPLCVRISSPLPYGSLHLLCTLSDPLTCVVPRPVRLKLAFCMTCAVRVLVLAQGPSF